MSDHDSEVKQVKTELEVCKTSLEDDNKRADDIIAFTKEKPEPFSENYTGENAWVNNKSSGGGGCAIL